MLYIGTMCLLAQCEYAYKMSIDHDIFCDFQSLCDDFDMVFMGWKNECGKKFYILSLSINFY